MRELILYTALFLTFVGCSHVEPSEQIDKTDLIPRFSYVGYTITNGTVEVTFIDSSIYFNPVLNYQLAEYILVKQPIDIKTQLDSIKLTFVTPNRKDSKEAGLSMPITQFSNSIRRYNDPQFSIMVKSIIDLNYNTRGLFKKDATTLVDRLNSYFALWMHNHYPDIPNDHYFFGYDSWNVLRQYSNDLTRNKQSEATMMVNDLLSDTVIIPKSVSPQLSDILKAKK